MTLARETLKYETLIYGTFCRKNLAYALKAKKWQIYVASRLHILSYSGMQSYQKNIGKTFQIFPDFQQKGCMQSYQKRRVADDHILNFCQRAVTSHTTNDNAPKFPDFHSNRIHKVTFVSNSLPP